MKNRDASIIFDLSSPPNMNDGLQLSQIVNNSRSSIRSQNSHVEVPTIVLKSLIIPYRLLTDFWNGGKLGGRTGILKVPELIPKVFSANPFQQKPFNRQWWSGVFVPPDSYQKNNIQDGRRRRHWNTTQWSQNKQNQVSRTKASKLAWGPHV